MRDDLDAEPFAEDEPEDLITDAMVKKATWLIHKLAERRGGDYKEIQKKCKKFLGYENLAKVTLEDGHKIIDKLIELTGGEEEQGARVTDDGTTPQLPTEPGDGLPKKPIKNEPAEKEEEETKTEEDVVTATMRESIRAAVDITLKEVVEKEVPVQGLGGVIFDAKMAEEAD
jgi:hypothetical protein